MLSNFKYACYEKNVCDLKSGKQKTDTVEEML